MSLSPGCLRLSRALGLVSVIVLVGYLNHAIVPGLLGQHWGHIVYRRGFAYR